MSPTRAALQSILIAIENRDNITNAIMPSDKYRRIGYELKDHLELIKVALESQISDNETMTEKFGCADPECFGCEMCEIIP